METVKKIQQFVSYWFLRYTLVTEMYMVETWEKIVMHVLLTVLFGLFWYCNYSFISYICTKHNTFYRTVPMKTNITM